MMRFGSKNAYCARSKDTPCLRRLTLSFASSHSKLGASAIVWQDYHEFVWRTRDDPLMRFTRQTIGDTCESHDSVDGGAPIHGSVLAARTMPARSSAPTPQSSR